MFIIAFINIMILVNKLINILLVQYDFLMAIDGFITLRIGIIYIYKNGDKKFEIASVENGWADFAQIFFKMFVIAR